MCDDDVMFCSNCKRDIPQGNFVMHNVHCQRKLALCMKCDEPVPRSELAAHNANYHVMVECPACGHQCEKKDLADHQSSSCSRRAICCNFCHIETEASDLAEHENYCGSRTERCEECGEFVMLKYQQLHQDSNHGFLKLEDEPGPAPSWTSTRTSSNLLNDLSRQRKVSNASQDSVRPTSASNRLSPSKRTNDMPQINSATTATTTKDLHKKSIPSDDTGVDLDRLLAIRLAEQERAMNSVSSNPFEVHLGIPTKSKGELVALPCEFCQAMIPANQLVVHETGCRPDLACYKTKELPVNRHRKLSSSSDEEDNDGLPCEFCGALFPPQYLLQHQALCDISTHSQDGKLKNELGPSPQSKSHTPKKLLNLGPENSRLFPIASQDHGDDKNQYLGEMRAALKKPTASIKPIADHHYSSGSEHAQNDLGPASHRSYITPPSCTNGVAHLPPSTGAVPKQKAGRRVNTHEVSQEVPRSAASMVTFTGQLRYRNADGNR